MHINELINILACPKHLTDLLFLQNTNEIICNKCVGGGRFKVLNSNPVKIDFTNNFSSEISTDISENKFNTKNWSNSKKDNLKFLLNRNIDKDSLGLDIGAGYQSFQPFLKLENLVSIDFTNYPGINIVHDLNLDIPFTSESFEFILMTNVLEHLYNDRVIAEANRLLKKGSRLYITVPFLLDVHQKPYDYHRYTYLYLQQKLEKEGFEIEIFSPSGDFGTFQVLAEHYFRFKIDNGSKTAKFLWQFQKIINFYLKKNVPIYFRNDFTVGYMIQAKKR
jgi:SAM-dependent methyltransferase